MLASEEVEALAMAPLFIVALGWVLYDEIQMDQIFIRECKHLLRVSKGEGMTYEASHSMEKRMGVWA